MASTRMFNSKTFSRQQWFPTRPKADALARSLRTRGNRARVIPEAGGWVVYVRSRSVRTR